MPVNGEQAVFDPVHASRPRSDPDVELLASVARRDLRAFEALYRLYHPRLTRFLMRMTRRPPIVDEVLNDTLMVVWERPERFNGTSKVSSWIFAIAYRKALKAMQRQDIPIESAADDPMVDPDPGPEYEAHARRMRIALLDVLKRLSVDHRMVVELTYFHDFGYHDIAEIMDCPVDTVKSRMFYARRHLGRLCGGDLTDWL